MYILRLNLEFNPIPYKRTTQRAMFVSKDYQRYKAFKELLRLEFLKQNKGLKLNEKTFYAYELEIGFLNKKHADADNIAKGVLDAIFKNDKNVICGKYEVKSFKKAYLALKIYEFDFKESNGS